MPCGIPSVKSFVESTGIERRLPLPFPIPSNDSQSTYVSGSGGIVPMLERSDCVCTGELVVLDALDEAYDNDGNCEDRDAGDRVGEELNVGSGVE